MKKIVNNIIKKLLKIKSWSKIEDKYSGEWSWTEYTDHRGKVYIIYNLIPEPGFQGTKLEKS